MKIQLNSSDLLRCLNAVGKVMSSKNSLSILDSALLSETGGKYFITGGDSVNSLSMPLDLTLLEGDFQPVCMKHKMLTSAISSIGSQPVTMTFEPSGKGFAVQVKYLSGDFKFVAEGADDYPPTRFPEPQNDEERALMTEYQLPSPVLLSALRNALPNTASDELRLVMNGVYMDATADGIVNMVASDGHTMYKEVYEHGIPFYTQGGPKGIILPKTVIAAIDLAFRNTGLICITANDSMIRLQATATVPSASPEGGIITLYARTIEGRYPNYGAVIPQNQPYHLTLNRRELEQAVKRVALFASDATQLVKMQYKDGTIILQGEDIDFSTSAKETLMPTEANLPDGFTIGFKSTALLTHLAYLPSENITMELTDGSKALILRTDGKGTIERVPKQVTKAADGTEQTVPAIEDSVVCLVMPMILNE